MKNPVTKASTSHRASLRFGLLNWLQFRIQLMRISRVAPGRKLTFRTNELLHTVVCRAGSSDLSVFCQIFLEREYSCLDDIHEAAFVVDCGANVGYSSAFFLSRFPTCHLVAVEPDPDNYSMLCNNVGAYGSRVKTIPCGLWSHPTRLQMDAASTGAGKEWARSFQEGRQEDTSGIPATDVATIIAGSPFGRISILKVDIEGAEAVVFGKTSAGWIDRVDCIVIELHKDSPFGPCEEIFHAAIAGRGFVVTTCGELTVCKRPAPVR